MHIVQIKLFNTILCIYIKIVDVQKYTIIHYVHQVPKSWNIFVNNKQQN